MGSDVPRELKKLVQSCWALEVNQRPSVLEMRSSLEEIAAPIKKDIKRAKSKLLSELDKSSDDDEEDTEESEDESDESEESEDERQRREQEERKEKDRKKEKKREESKRSKAAAADDEELVSRLVTHGSYKARDSGTVLHLCMVESISHEAYTDTVRAIRPAALLWPEGPTPPSVPGVQVLRVDDGWNARVRGLQDAESRGHKTVAVAPGVSFLVDIKPLLDAITARRDPAATDVWLLWGGHTDVLSGWQQEMDADSRYHRIK